MPRLCLVADVHHGDQSHTKLGHTAERLMEEFTAFCNRQAPDLVIDLGDRISDVDHATDLKLEREAAQFFSPINSPVKHICGNHDRDHLSVAENEEILGQALGNEVVDLDDWQIIIFRADTFIHRPGGFKMPERDLLWLAGVIAEATKPTAVFSHVPLSGHRQLGNYYFQNNADFAEYPDATDRIRAILATARVPLACFAGHVHWNTCNFIQGQPHITLQSLTESFTTVPNPAGAYAMLNLTDQVDWQVFGLDQLTLSLPIAQTARRWIEPIAAFGGDRASARKPSAQS